MKSIKSVLSILTLAAALFAASVQPAKAQIVDVSPIIVYNSVTTNLAGLGYLVIDCSAQRNVAIKWTLQMGGAGTEVHGVRLFPSNDGTLPSSPTLATGYSMAIAANGTTAVTVHTNFDTLGYRYLVGGYLTNGTAQLATNTFSYFVKRNAP